MRKIFKHIGALVVSALCIVVFSACSKDDFISRISDTYAVQTQGASSYFNKENGKVWDIRQANGNVKYYVNPSVPLISYPDDATNSAAASSYVRLVKEEMDGYGYTSTENEDEADLLINISNFRLFYTNIVWVPGAVIDPYYLFWGGYYPWLYTPIITALYTNTVFIEVVDAPSLRTYRDWYQNTWVPNNQGKYPTESNIPEDKRPLTVWKCDISGELTTESSEINDSYVFDRIPQAFSQSSYMDIN